MRAGRLRHRVTIQSKSVTRDDYGAETITWSDVATVWASVEPVRGREFMEQRRDGAEVTTRIRMRYQGSTEIKPEHRATWDGHVYDIQSVIYVEERNREIQLMCREVLGDGWSGA